MAACLVAHAAHADEVMVRVMEAAPNVPLAIVEEAPSRLLLARPKRRQPAEEILAEEQIDRAARKFKLKEKPRHRHLKWRKFEPQAGQALDEAKRLLEETQ